MKISDFNNALLYSNRNIEKLAKNLVNESANAVVMEMFDDKCILADHTTGQIFEADYNFDGKNFVFENFQEVSLEKDNTSIVETIRDYFDDKNVNLALAYEENSASNSDTVEQSLAEALSSKNVGDVIDYTQLSGINEEVSELKETELYKLYEERLNTHPTDKIKMFDWVNPVKVSLIDEDSSKIVNKTFKEKAKKLRADPDVKKEISEAAAEFVNDGTLDIFEDFIKNNPSVLALDNAGLKELVGYSIMGDKSLMENRTAISNAFNGLITEDEIYSERRTDLLNEEDGEEEDPAPEASEADLTTLKNALEKAKAKVSDEKLLNKIEELISAIDAGSETGETDVKAVKEAVELLNF